MISCYVGLYYSAVFSNVAFLLLPSPPQPRVLVLQSPEIGAGNVRSVYLVVSSCAHCGVIHNQLQVLGSTVKHCIHIDASTTPEYPCADYSKH